MFIKVVEVLSDYDVVFKVKVKQTMVILVMLLLM